MSGSALTVVLKAGIFTAMKATSFSYIPYGSLSHLIAARLRGQGIRVRAETELDDQDRGVNDGSWVLSTDPAVQPVHPEWFMDYETQPLEVISPQLALHSERWEVDIERIFSSRSGQANPILNNSSNFFTDLNSSTTLQVHIGNDPHADTGFSFHTVRNLAMILLVYEPVLDNMFSLEKPLKGLKSPRWLSPRKSPHFLPPNVARNCPRSVLAKYLLETCPDIPSVVRAMNPTLPELNQPNDHCYFKYSFSSLLDPVGGTNNHADANPATSSRGGTIQFRQPVEALDPETMIHWIRFLGSLVDFASEVTLGSLKETLGIGEGNARAVQPSARPPEIATTQPLGTLLRLYNFMDRTNVLDGKTGRFWHRPRQYS
ncbi:hypothetical protein FQN55_000663 [Onygenales sp. PD_40]|nr:hypothetical protein FQN55_000663 [Onygenales sp. PD_40]KAK2775434.1 hypothetical protein FQN52_004004 [Onygenales sp. PD_12]